MFIVELEPGVWLSWGAGDPPRTLVESNAVVFLSEADALESLKVARFWRPFDKAMVVPVRQPTTTPAVPPEQRAAGVA